MNELHLKVYSNRSELVKQDGSIDIFVEGPANPQARVRYKKISDELNSGFLVNQIEKCRDNPGSLSISRLTDEQTKLLDSIVSSITSEVGRALVGLTILQLCVKAIEPGQSIRLHKAGQSKRDFSWSEGISMRSLDNQYITPALRRFDLVKLNKDGFMMTRSLAENYPYSKVYKAQMRGARAEWVVLVELIETNQLNPLFALQYLLSQLLNKAETFKELGKETLKKLRDLFEAKNLTSKISAFNVIEKHIYASDYAARIMEIAMHSLMQAMYETNVFGNANLIPLSQMRSANKKHGNIGDIEIQENGLIIEAWDAKFGKSYLRDELEELNDKLQDHPAMQLAGFVTSGPPERFEELKARIEEIESLTDVEIKILTFSDWIDNMFQRASDEGIEEVLLARKWITAYAESIAQQRLSIAPIDEPCYQWLWGLNQIFNSL